MKIAGREGDCHPGTPHHVHVKALDCWFPFWGLWTQIHDDHRWSMENSSNVQPKDLGDKGVVYKPPSFWQAKISTCLVGEFVWRMDSGRGGRWKGWARRWSPSFIAVHPGIRGVALESQKSSGKDLQGKVNKHTATYRFLENMWSKGFKGLYWSPAEMDSIW